MCLGSSACCNSINICLPCRVMKGLNQVWCNLDWKRWGAAQWLRDTPHTSSDMCLWNWCLKALHFMFGQEKEERLWWCTDKLQFLFKKLFSLFLIFFLILHYIRRYNTTASTVHLMVWKERVSGRNSYRSFTWYLTKFFLSSIIFINHALFSH